VPAANVLGEVGQGFKVAMKILNSGRTGLGGGSVGAMKKIIELATAQASERSQFGKPIREYGLVRRSFVFGVEGSYGALRQLVYLLELTPSFLTLESIRVGEVGTGGQLRAELSLSTLFIAEPEPAGKGRS